MNISKYRVESVSVKQLILYALCFVSYQALMAQNSSEISLHVKGQFSKLSYDYPGGNNEMENGYGVGINYAYYLNENWSLSTGAEYQSFTTNAYSSMINGSSLTTDSEGEDFEFRYSASRYVEDQEATFINIPVKIQYESSGSVAFYAAGGLKLGFNVEADYDYRALDLSTSGYYEQYDAELKDPRFIGFGDFGTYEGKSEFELDTNFILNLETGVKLETGYNQNLYVGVFLDYGLNDLKKDSREASLFTYNPEEPTAFRNAGILYATDGINPIVREIKTIAFGLKLKYGLKF